MNAADTDDAQDAGGDRMARLERTVAALVERVEDLAAERVTGAGSGSTDPSAEAEPSLPEQFWALNALKERLPSPGGVVYSGSVDLPVGHVEYQWGRVTEHLLEADWAERSDRLAALGHPLRLAMLRLLLNDEHTVAQLVDELDLASTGVAYHHLNQLQAARWVISPRRGVWAISPSRTIPLLAIITAIEEG